MLSKNIQALIQSQRKMLELAASLDEDILQHRIKPDSWTVLEVIEHLVISETGILAFFKKYNPANTTRPSSWKSRLSGKVLKWWLNSPFKAKIPDERLGPQGGKTLKQLTEEWGRIRLGLMDVFDHFPKEKKEFTVFKHPIFGPLTMPQSIDFMSQHINRHIKQIKEIARHYASQKEIVQ